jgi:aspartate racemase
MKTLGLIGGTGWVSSVEYYRLINEGINKLLGGQQYAKCILYSLNYGEIAKYSKEKNEDAIFGLVSKAALLLEEGGCDCLALCANTAHVYYDRLIKEVSVPVLHIAEATATAIKKQNMSTVGLLGTKRTMESNFYQDVMAKHGIKTLIPDEEQRNFIHATIFNELFYEDFREETRQRFLQIMEKLVDQGAGGIVLGCTEIPLLIKQEHTSIPVFNTLDLHAEALVDFAVK